MAYSNGSLSRTFFLLLFLSFSLCFSFSLRQTFLDDAIADAAKERKLRDQADKFARQLEDELETLKQRKGGNGAIATASPSQGGSVLMNILEVPGVSVYDHVRWLSAHP